MSYAFAAIWNATPLILSGGFLLLFLVGFWRGMSIKPRPADEHAPERWWSGSGF